MLDNVTSVRPSLQRKLEHVFPALLGILVGGGAGALVVIASNVESKWAAIVVVAVAVPTVALLVNDLRKLILIALVVDIPLGLDIAFQDRAWHQGGPTGYIVSLMTIALIVGYALWIAERRPRVQFYPQTTIPALLYLFTILLSLLQSRDLQLSAFGLFLHCQFILMYFYLVNHVETWADVRLIVITVVVCLLLESALMVMQYFLGTSLNIGAISSTSFDPSASAGATGPRVGGTIGSANSAAAYLASSLALAFGVHLAGNLVDKRLTFLALVLGVTALIATSARSAWGSLVLALLILLLQILRTDAGKKAILILLVGGLLFGIVFGKQVQRRLQTASTDRTRSELATMARNIIREHPFGVGENNYDQVMSDRYAHPNWVGHTLLPVHNKYLLVWAETGPQGLVALIVLMVAVAWQAKRWLFRLDVAPHVLIVTASLLGVFAGYAFHMRTEGFASRSNVQIFWFTIALMAVVSRSFIQTESTHSIGDVVA